MNKLGDPHQELGRLERWYTLLAEPYLYPTEYFNAGPFGEYGFDLKLLDKKLIAYEYTDNGWVYLKRYDYTFNDQLIGMWPVGYCQRTASGKIDYTRLDPAAYCALLPRHHTPVDTEESSTGECIPETPIGPQ